MNRFRKEDSEDPTHKWIGTYNSNLIHVVKFFKWLHYPNIEPTKRLKPEVVQNFPKLRRLEIYDYEPPTMQQDATGFKSYDKRVGEMLEKVGDHFKWQHKNEEMRQEIYDTLDRLSPGWKEPYFATLRRPLTEEEREKVEGFLEQLRNEAPDSEDYYHDED